MNISLTNKKLSFKSYLIISTAIFLYTINRLNFVCRSDKNGYSKYYSLESVFFHQTYVKLISNWHAFLDLINSYTNICLIWNEISIDKFVIYKDFFEVWIYNHRSKYDVTEFVKHYKR